MEQKFVAVGSVLNGFIAQWLVLCCLITCFMTGAAQAHVPSDLSIGAPDNFATWKTLETEHFRINFQVDHLTYAQKMAAIAEKVHVKTTEWLQWVPKDKTEIIISDSFDGSNGGAVTQPYNRFFIFMNTPSDGELQDNGSWVEMVFTHEYIHILHLDQVAALPALARNVVGRLFFTFPQIFNPKWVTEGLAVYGETDNGKGFGRGQGAIYHAMMREEVVNGLRSLEELSYQGYRGTDWPSNQVYLYGYYFFEFLESRYSKEKIIRYIQNWNRNIVPWRMDSRSHRVLGVSTQKLWGQYQHYLTDKFGPEIEQNSASEKAIAEAEDKEKSKAKDTLNDKPAAIEKWEISGGRINSNPRVSSNGDTYFYKNDGRTEPNIEKLDANYPKEGSRHTLSKVHAFSMFDWHDEKGILLSRGEICDNTNVFSDLYHWNSTGKRWDRLTECGRYPRAAWRSDGMFIVAVHVEGGMTNLDLLNDKGRLLSRLPALAEGDSLGDIDWFVAESAEKGVDDLLEGKIVASVRRKSSGWNLELLDLKTQQWQLLTQNKNLQSKPQFSVDGTAVYFISDKDNKQNVRQLNVSTGLITTVSNSDSYIKDFSVDGKRMVLMEYHAEGFGLRSIDSMREFGADYEAKTTDSVAVLSLENAKSFQPENYNEIHDYSIWPSIRPRAWWAMLLSDGVDNTSLQLLVDGSDALGFHRWQFAPQYFFDKEEFGGDASYIFYNRIALLASRKVDIEQDSDLSNNIPEVKDIENRYQAIYMQPINSLEESFRFHVGVAKETVDRTIEGVGKLEGEDNLLGLSLQFSNTERYLHSISDEDGRQIKLNFEQYNVFGDGNYDGAIATLEWNEYISFNKSHVLALRWVQGKASESAKPFQLGGNLDQYSTLAGAIGFGLSDYALRGYSSHNAKLRGSKVSLFSAEWNIPLIEVFNGFMKPPIGLGKTSATIFVDSGRAWDSERKNHYHSSIGVEFKPQVLVGLDNFQLNSSVGFAYGLDEEIGEGSIYFRLGVNL